jgi:hypothetical protein
MEQEFSDFIHHRHRNHTNHTEHESHALNSTSLFQVADTESQPESFFDSWFLILMLALLWVASMFFAFKQGKKVTTKTIQVDNPSLSEEFMRV